MSAQNSVEATVVSISSKSMGGGATASVLGWLSSNEGIALIGISVTLLGFIVNLIFQIRRDRREQELQRAKLVAIENDSDNK